MKISGMVRGKKKEKKGQEGGMTENVEKKKSLQTSLLPIICKPIHRNTKTFISP